MSQSPPKPSPVDTRDTSAHPPLFRVSALVDVLAADAEAAWEAREAHRPRGVVTRFKNVDEALGGFMPPGIQILHGAAGAGKTAYALQVAASCGAPALFVSTEMGPLELFRRVTARLTETFLGKFKSGELHPSRARDLAEAAALICPDLAIVDATIIPASATWLAAMMVEARGAHPHGLMVVDSLHSWAGAMAPPGVSEYDTINEALLALRRLAAGCDVAVLAISERNRLSSDSGGLTAGRGSGKIEYSADSMLELGRHKDAPLDVNGEVVVELKIAKNRNGPAGEKFPLTFSGRLQRFTA
jgi:replicative DNA helicase